MGDTTDDAIEMRVSGLTVDPLTSSPILMLKNDAREITLPIWIGLVEASAIATELEELEISRPLTHDLLKATIDALEANVVRVEINDVRENTFFASLLVEHGDVIHAIDARPSDAIALAIRCQAPIYVSRVVIHKSKQMNQQLGELTQLEDPEQWSEILENLSPEDFGKYKM